MPDRTPKLIVTGHDKDGRPMFVSDSVPASLEIAGPAVQAQFLWGDDSIPEFPNDGSAPSPTQVAPPPGGTRFATLTIAPGADHLYHGFITAAMGPYGEPESPGFHRTPTLDFIYVLSGELALDLSETQTAIVKTGDSVVLNGVRHRWRNTGAQAATLLAVQVGAHDHRRQ